MYVSSQTNKSSVNKKREKNQPLVECCLKSQLPFPCNSFFSIKVDHKSKISEHKHLIEIALKYKTKNPTLCTNSSYLLLIKTQRCRLSIVLANLLSCFHAVCALLGDDQNIRICWVGEGRLRPAAGSCHIWDARLIAPLWSALCSGNPERSEFAQTGCHQAHTAGEGGGIKPARPSISSLDQFFAARPQLGNRRRLERINYGLL